jgi:fatty-acyl-CoA synthase
MCRGYWNRPEADAEAFLDGGWFRTGDVAYLDDEGFCYIVDRIKDLVIRGGENIYPREVEEFLYGHPQIEDVQVIGVPDEKYGEELCAWIRVRGGAELTAGDIRAYCTGKIAHYKIPRYVRLTTEFPMTVTGKIQKYKMRETSISELGLQAASETRTA